MNGLKGPGVPRDIQQRAPMRRQCYSPAKLSEHVLLTFCATLGPRDDASCARQVNAPRPASLPRWV
eukprot:5832556-Prymnesium_polylepis.1